MEQGRKIAVNDTIVEESMKLLDTTAPSTIHQELTFSASTDYTPNAYIKVHKRSAILVAFSIIG